MGGLGSGKSGWRHTVEGCLTLDANLWMRKGVLAPGRLSSGSWMWSNSYTEEKIASIGYEVNTLDKHNPVCRLYYKRTNTGEEKIETVIKLVTTTPHFGGLRWWFICPLIVRGRACWRRVGKLYLPNGAKYFGCRHCYNLTYTSCNESHNNDSLFRLIALNMSCAPEIVRAAFKDK